MQHRREQTGLEEEEVRKRSQLQAQAQAQTQAKQDQQRALQIRAELREEEARLKRKEQQLDYDRLVALKVKEQVDKANQAQEARMDKIHDLLIKNADKDTSYRPKDPPTYQRHTKAAQPAKFKGEGEKLPVFKKSLERYIAWENINEEKATELLPFYLDDEALS